MHRLHIYPNSFISHLIAKKSSISVYLKNGNKITGQLIGETEGMVFLNTPVPQIIYKNRISAVIPQYGNTSTIKNTNSFANTKNERRQESILK